MTQTDQMNESNPFTFNQEDESIRSDEQAQSQDRERLQEDIEAAWRRLMNECNYHKVPYSDLRLLRWALGLGS
jgi:hypothetical protein